MSERDTARWTMVPSFSEGDPTIMAVRKLRDILPTKDGEGRAHDYLELWVIGQQTEASVAIELDEARAFADVILDTASGEPSATLPVDPRGHRMTRFGPIPVTPRVTPESGLSLEAGLRAVCAGLKIPAPRSQDSHSQPRFPHDSPANRHVPARTSPQFAETLNPGSGAVRVTDLSLGPVAA